MLFEVLILGLVLSADSFSAAMAMGSRPFTTKDSLKFAFSSGGAELVATLAGYMAGAHLISLISSVDHWIAFGLLAAVALHMAYEAIQDLRGQGEKEEAVDFHSFWKVLLVSFATSLDAFGVGVSLGVAKKTIAPFLVSIGLWAFVATLVGLHLARRLSGKMGPLFTFIGAAVLGYMSIQMLSI
ncbi:manganese efflux pump MntP family protein [Bdellovibrio sp. HCB288]|uniref:manganese efflux pump MntP n=1 Tax=Bdellovibrio sp. HCB288 TaxID=3394355 RepID=UPI0039B55895